MDLGWVFCPTPGVTIQWQHNAVAVRVKVQLRQSSFQIWLRHSVLYLTFASLLFAFNIFTALTRIKGESIYGNVYSTYFLAISKIRRNESLHECTNLGRLQCLCLTIPLPTPWPIQDQYSNLKRWSKVFRNRAVISIIFVSKWAFL